LDGNQAINKMEKCPNKIDAHKKKEKWFNHSTEHILWKGILLGVENIFKDLKYIPENKVCMHEYVLKYD
jgi:hypothetical protein